MEEKTSVKQMIDDLVEKAKIASQEYLKLDQETVDNITRAMSMAGLENHMELFGWKKSKIGYCSGGIVTLPYEIYSKLNNISCFKQGKPHLEEIGFSLIKKRKIF